MDPSAIVKRWCSISCTLSAGLSALSRLCQERLAQIEFQRWFQKSFQPSAWKRLYSYRGSSLKLKINVAPALDVSALNIDEYEQLCLSQEPRPDSDLSRVLSKPEPGKISRNVIITFIIGVNVIINSFLLVHSLKQLISLLCLCRFSFCSCEWVARPLTWFTTLYTVLFSTLLSWLLLLLLLLYPSCLPAACDLVDSEHLQQSTWIVNFLLVTDSFCNVLYVFCSDQNQLFFTGSRSISICDHTDQKVQSSQAMMFPNQSVNTALWRERNRKSNLNKRHGSIECCPQITTWALVDHKHCHLISVT